MRLLTLIACLAGAGLSGCSSQPRRTSASHVIPSFIGKACADDLAAAGASCGTVSVPENRNARDGRIIDLHVVVLPATAGSPLPPIFDIDGGPGLPATKNAGFYFTDGAAYRAGRDIVLIDQRGTGQSNGLHCPELAAPEIAHREMLPREAVARCREQLSSRADLRQYGTDAAVADLDAVRAALGYDQIDLMALSYGTTVALRYMVGHEQRVRAAVLMGVSPPTAMSPQHHAPGGQRALQLLFQDCAADPQCHAAFPAPFEDLRRAMGRLSRGEQNLLPEVFLERLRSLMYSPPGARRLPWIVSRAAAGDFEPFYAATRPPRAALLADGMFLSVTCSETLPLMPFGQAVSAARTTLFGDYRLRRQQAACKEWPAGEVAPGFLSPIRSAAAVLLISGHLDPVTPPDLAEAIRAGLPNSRHLVLRYSGHIFDGLSGIDTCLDPLVRSFLSSGKAAELDVSCLDQMTPPPFRTD